MAVPPLAWIEWDFDPSLRSDAARDAILERSEVAKEPAFRIDEHGHAAVRQKRPCYRICDS
jgi:hypothetical protein